MLVWWVLYYVNLANLLKSVLFLKISCWGWGRRNDSVDKQISVCVCVCVCVCVWWWCLCICVSVFYGMWIFVCVYICVFVYMYVCSCVYIYVCVYLWVCLWICVSMMYVCVCVSVCLFIFVFVCVLSLVPSILMRWLTCNSTSRGSDAFSPPWVSLRHTCIHIIKKF